MEEGERLSKKQLAQESTIKKLRASLKEAAEARASLDATLASERTRLQDALSARAAVEEARQVSRPEPGPLASTILRASRLPGAPCSKCSPPLSCHATS